MQLVCDTCKTDSFKASTGKKRENDIHQWVGPSMPYQKTGKISCEEMTVNYFIIFPTIVFLRHKICQLRNNYYRCKMRVYTTLERTLHFTGEEARPYCVQLALCPHLHPVCMRRQIQECLHVLRKQLKGLTRK